MNMKLAGIISTMFIILLVSFHVKAQQDSVMRFSLEEAQKYAIEHFYMSKNAELDITIICNGIIPAYSG